jgi:hypothetical protein
MRWVLCVSLALAIGGCSPPSEQTGSTLESAPDDAAWSPSPVPSFTAEQLRDAGHKMYADDAAAHLPGTDAEKRDAWQAQYNPSYALLLTEHYEMTKIGAAEHLRQIVDQCKIRSPQWRDTLLSIIQRQINSLPDYADPPELTDSERLALRGYELAEGEQVRKFYAGGCRGQAALPFMDLYDNVERGMADFPIAPYTGDPNG